MNFHARYTVATAGRDEGGAKMMATPPAMPLLLLVLLFQLQHASAMDVTKKQPHILFMLACATPTCCRLLP
jgi:hypothetical protein